MISLSYNVKENKLFIYPFIHSFEWADIATLCSPSGQSFSRVPVSCVSVSLTRPYFTQTSVCLCVHQTGRVPRAVASLNQHVLTSEDVVSCCLDLGAPSISFRINGQPVQGMFENFNTDGLFFPVVSFSAGVKWVFIPPRLSRSLPESDLLDRVARWRMNPAGTWVWWAQTERNERNVPSANAPSAFMSVRKWCLLFIRSKPLKNWMCNNGVFNVQYWRRSGKVIRWR